MGRVAAGIWVHWASGTWNRSDQQSHAVVARLVQQGCCEEKKSSRPGGAREGASRRDGCRRQTVSVPAHNDDLVRRLPVSCDRLGLVRRLGRWVDPAATSRKRAGRGPLCPARADALDGNSAGTNGASASGGFRARPPEPVAVLAGGNAAVPLIPKRATAARALLDAEAVPRWPRNSVNPARSPQPHARPAGLAFSAYQSRHSIRRRTHCLPAPTWPTSRTMDTPDRRRP